jgi:hypothetical protein
MAFFNLKKLNKVDKNLLKFKVFLNETLHSIIFTRKYYDLFCIYLIDIFIFLQMLIIYFLILMKQCS